MAGAHNLSFDLAAGFAQAALANVTREYPRKLDHLLDAPHGDLTPRKVHPAFYGSYDWHSAVHMHWLLVRVIRLHPGLPQADAIANVLDTHLSSESIATEQAYFGGAGSRTFERPYGWAWVLELQAEALRLAAKKKGPETKVWSQALDPFARYLSGRMSDFLAQAVYPMRMGMHANTAFACILALDYARMASDTVLAEAIDRAARRWFLGDRDAPVEYEPSLADFLSPVLVEAQLMREVLPKREFVQWLRKYLPHGLGPLASPPAVPDRSDAQLAHLDGLSLSRAWSLQRIASALGKGDPRRNEFHAVAERHLAASLPQAVGGDYVGEHWLASFAALALGEVP